MEAVLDLRTIDGDTVSLEVAAGLFTLPGSLDHIDLCGYWALPGLADCHAHLSVDSLNETGRSGEIEGIRHRAYAQLEGGVFLVVDKGWRDDTVLELLADPPRSRPHVEAAGRIITGPHGYFPGFAVETDEAGLVDAVLAADKRGGWVKLVGDWPQKGRGPVTNFGEEALAAAVAVAHAAGARVAIHTMAPEVPALAVRAGVDSIEHGLFLSAFDLEALAARNGAWVPTVVNAEDVMAGLGAGSSGARVLGDGVANVGRLLPYAAEMGSIVLCGTDLGLPHGRVAREAIRLAQLGLPTVAAVAAVSFNAYQYLDVPVLKPGASADFLLFDRNPIDDIFALASPVAGMRAGRVVFDRTGLLPSQQ